MALNDSASIAKQEGMRLQPAHRECNSRSTLDGTVAQQNRAAIFYLATTGGLTGQTIVVDGGLLALGPMESAAPR